MTSAPGEELVRAANLTPQCEGYSEQYSEDTDPTIANVFATAAFRFGHSQIQVSLYRFMIDPDADPRYLYLLDRS